MASSSIGSDVFAIFALLIISILVLVLLRHYLPLRTTPAYLLTPVFFALALPCSIILLVPIDLSSSAGTETDEARGIHLPEGLILVSWRITYWLTFMLTWLVLPLLGDYSDSGFREPRDRLMYSLRTNAKYQLITIGVAAFGLVYFLLQEGLHGKSLKSLVMALAYTWGLIMAVYLMGHGLVAIPRRFFRSASVSGRLRRLQTHAPKIHDKVEEATEELAQVEGQLSQIHQRKSNLPTNLRDWVEELADASTSQDGRPGNRQAGTGVPAVITERYMADLTRKLKRARHKKARFANEWKSLVQDASDLQSILDAASSRRLTGKSRLPFMTPTLRYRLHAYVLPGARMCLGAIFSLASIALVWSEIVHVSERGWKVSLVGLSVVHDLGNAHGNIGFSGQVIASLWLLYMCAAALYSMSEIKVWGNRALVKRQTYAESACWYSLQVAKLTVPLSFNFITMLPYTVYHQTQFYIFLGKLIDLTPLGQGFSQYFPVFILFPIFATLFNLYGKIKNVVGLGVLDDESEENAAELGTGGWRDGQFLIERETQDGDARVGLAPAPYRDSSARSSIDTRGRPEGRAPLLPLSNTSAPTRSDPREHIANEELDDSSRAFFQDLGDRVRNTFETTDRPKWMKDFSFKKPKWMNNHDDQGGGGLGRIFGGGSNDGVRL